MQFRIHVLVKNTKAIDKLLFAAISACVFFNCFNFSGHDVEVFFLYDVWEVILYKPHSAEGRILVELTL